MNDPYAVLGLQRGASEQDAKKAFRDLAKTCHPDLHPNDANAEQRFKEINAAYDAICNPQPEPMQWRTYHTGNSPFGSPFGPGSPFDDVFAEVFGQRRNSDVNFDCRLTLEEAFHGKEISLTTPGTAPRTIKVNIPPGIAHGMRVRVPQAGHHSHPSMSPGDLNIIVSVLPHGRFARQANHLLTIVAVSVFDVLLCKDIEVVGIDGHVLRVGIPPGFDSRKLRLAGQGMPDPHVPTSRGDLLIDLNIQYPVLTTAQQSLIEAARTPDERTS